MKGKKWMRTFLGLAAAVVMFSACSKKETPTGGEATPAPTETAEPSIKPEPTAKPTTEPTKEPEASPELTAKPTTEPTKEPESTVKPTAKPTKQPEPTAKPTTEPTKEPESTVKPTAKPTKQPEPTAKPTKQPEPTAKPTKQPEPTAKPTKQPELTAKPTKQPEPTAKPTKQPEPTAEPSVTVKPAKLAEMELADIFEQIYSKVTSELPMLANKEITAENVEYFLGTTEVEFKEAIASEAMIITVPYSVCLIRMPEGSDIEATKKLIVESAQPNKWVCVGVEPKNVLVGNIDNIILLVMTKSISQEIMDAFLSLQETGEPETVLSQAVSPDKNGLLVYKGSYAKALGKYKEKSAIQLGEKIEAICKSYLKEQKNVFYSVIPDKSYFMPNTVFSTTDYFDMLYVLQQNVKNAIYIPINYNLELEDYYKTDLHWKQEELFPILEMLGMTMGFQVSEDDFTKIKLQPYRGVYAPYMAGNTAEELIYLTSKFTEEAKVEIYDREGTFPVYLLEEWESDVPYNLFLGGPNPLVTITNPSVQNGKELIIFGDSFMSSMAPLLTGVYEKITLVDLRFVMSDYLAEVIDFHGQDVLFLYNMAVVNDSTMLK